MIQVQIIQEREQQVMWRFFKFNVKDVKWVSMTKKQVDTSIDLAYAIRTYGVIIETGKHVEGDFTIISEPVNTYSVKVKAETTKKYQ